MRATPDFDFQLGEAAEMIRESVGRFADEPLAGRLQQLASEEPEINLDDARVEFAGLIRGLTQQDPMVRMRELSARPFADLSTAERAELTELTRELSARKLPHA